MTLFVNEIFGPTFQGEGPTTGYPVIFLRMAGCNLACSWCDTPYSWDWKRFDKSKEVARYSVNELYNVLKNYSIHRLVISGGEPMLQQKELLQVTQLLHDAGWMTEIETAGTITPITMGLVKHWNISPKLSTSGNGDKRINPNALKALNQAGSRAFKFVITRAEDFDEVDDMVKTYLLSPVYIMPEGINGKDIRRKLTEFVPLALERNYRITTRLQVELYGNRRAV